MSSCPQVMNHHQQLFSWAVYFRSAFDNLWLSNVTGWPSCNKTSPNAKSEAERKFTAQEKELLTVIHFLRTWIHYLLGFKFLVKTDNRQSTTSSLNQSRLQSKLVGKSSLQSSIFSLNRKHVTPTKWRTPSVARPTLQFLKYWHSYQTTQSLQQFGSASRRDWEKILLPTPLWKLWRKGRVAESG